MSKFPDWMTKVFLEWQTQQGKRKTLEEFATYIGVSRPLVNMWMNGNQKPGADNIKLLGDLFGDEIYDALENVSLSSAPVGAPLYRHSIFFEADLPIANRRTKRPRS